MDACSGNVGDGSPFRLPSGLSATNAIGCCCAANTKIRLNHIHPGGECRMLVPRPHADDRAPKVQCLNHCLLRPPPALRFVGVTLPPQPPPCSSSTSYAHHVRSLDPIHKPTIPKRRRTVARLHTCRQHVQCVQGRLQARRPSRMGPTLSTHKVVYSYGCIL